MPFLDHQLVELAAQIPPELKLGSGGKHVLKAIARGRGDRSQKKLFSNACAEICARRFSGLHAGYFELARLSYPGLYQREYVDTLLDAPEQHHTRIQGSKLWHLALLEYWLQHHA